MSEIILKLTAEQYNTIMNALSASVQWTQQNTAVLMASIQAQSAAQMPAVNAAPALQADKKA